MTAIAETEAPGRYVILSKGGVVKVGALAGTDVIHGMVPDAWTGTSCMACWGWADDPRHLTKPTVPVSPIPSRPIRYAAAAR